MGAGTRPEEARGSIGICLSCLSNNLNCILIVYISCQLIGVGAFASGLSSLVTTPLDVIKTRLSTGMLPAGSPIFRSVTNIARTEGWHALYAGAEVRILWSALYGGIGLYCFECTKSLLGLSSGSV